MPMTRLTINTLSGGVGRQAPTKRLASEAENIDNCLVTIEKSVEKRPPLSQVAYSTQAGPTNSSYLPVSNLDAPAGFNEDNLYFHYLDIDGFNRYCIIINRTGYPFDPTQVGDNEGKFIRNIGGIDVEINLSNFISVFRIEPTEWVEEPVDTSAGLESNTSGFNRGIFEYLTFGNKSTTSNYRIANQLYTDIAPKSIQDTFGSMDYNVGCIIWNKLIPLDFMPDNGGLETEDHANWLSSISSNEYIHSGDVVNFKIADIPATKVPSNEDIINPTNPGNGYWKNVRDDIDFEIDPNTLEEEERGQSVENFSIVPQYPASEVYNDVRDLNGYKAVRMLNHYYDIPRLIPFTEVDGVDWEKDHYQLTSPLTAESRDALTGLELGLGKVYFCRNSYLTFPSGFYRATRYSQNPYFERIRSEGPNTVMDHRRMPLIIYKDTTTDGTWRISHMPVFPRRAGTSLSNPGPKAFERKETIQSMAIWKNRLWVATENTLFASRTNSFFNFWVNDVTNIVETDPIDIQASVGAYNRLSYIIPFQTILFVASSGSVQFEVRGGSIDTGISPFNVEFRPTSFYSTSKLVEPQRMGNNIFFMDAGRMYMYLSGSSFNDEYSTSVDVSTQCRGYLPTTFGAVNASSAVNSLMFVDGDNKNQIYFFTFRTNGDRIAQQAFHRWILSEQDDIASMKSYEKDLYIVSRRPFGPAEETTETKLMVYLVSLEAVPLATPMVDGLVKSSNILGIGGLSTQVTLPHYDPDITYVILSPEWGNDAYSVIEIDGLSHQLQGGIWKTTVVIPGNYDVMDGAVQRPVYVGRAYEMNIELSQQVQRSTSRTTSATEVYEGVLNLKKGIFRHLNSGPYDVVVRRNNRPETMVTFIPTDLNNIVTRSDQLKIDTFGELSANILSYSEKVQIFIKSAYPTPVNIANITFSGNFRTTKATAIE